MRISDWSSDVCSSDLAVYAPARSAAEGFLSTLGVTSTFYDPLAGARISELFQPTTRLVWVESPASFTMEVQDLPAIARAAHDRGALVAADCTWASPLGFKALRHGADLAVRSEEHPSELQSLMRTPYAVFCL